MGSGALQPAWLVHSGQMGLKQEIQEYNCAQMCYSLGLKLPSLLQPSFGWQSPIFNANVTHHNDVLKHKLLSKMNDEKTTLKNK